MRTQRAFAERVRLARTFGSIIGDALMHGGDRCARRLRPFFQTAVGVAAVLCAIIVVRPIVAPL